MIADLKAEEAKATLDKIESSDDEVQNTDEKKKKKKKKKNNKTGTGQEANPNEANKEELLTKGAGETKTLTVTGSDPILEKKTDDNDDANPEDAEKKKKKKKSIN